MVVTVRSVFEWCVWVLRCVSISVWGWCGGKLPLRRMFPRRMSPRRMPPRRKKAEKEEDRVRCPRDGRCVFVVVVAVVVFEECGS